jgi:hypothetical protein
MAYIRKKRVRRNQGNRWSYRYPDNPQFYTYYQLVEGYRDENGKVRQKVLAHLGRHSDPARAVAFNEQLAQSYKGSAADLRYAAQKMRERSIDALPREQWRRQKFNRVAGRGKWLVPKAGTPVPDEPPYPTSFAPKGWFYFPGETPEDAEREAAEAEARAEKYAERANRIRDVVTNHGRMGKFS